MTTPAPESKPADVAQLHARRHKWGQSTNIHRDSTKSGCDETWRYCLLCGTVKITVHQPEGFSYRSWQTPGGVRFVNDGTPLCEGDPS